MKKGQLLSQPFVLIFGVIVIALVFIFGSYMIYRLMKVECKVENEQFLVDLQKRIDEIYSIGFVGSSEECAVVKRYRQTDLNCEILKPAGVSGLCFVDLRKSIDLNEITVKELKEQLKLLEGKDDRNLFFSFKGEGCEMNAKRINKLDIPQPICAKGDEAEPTRFILENQGRKVVIKKA